MSHSALPSGFTLYWVNLSIHCVVKSMPPILLTHFEYMYTFLHHPFEAIDMTSSLNQKFITYLVNAEGNCYSLKSTVPNILMRTNILQNSLSAVKSRISKDCAVKMLTCRSRTCRRHGVHTIDKYHYETSAVIGVMLLTL